MRAENLVHVKRAGDIPDRATSVSLSSDAVLLKVDRFTQRFRRRGAVQGAVRAVLIVVDLVRAQDPPQMILAPHKGAVQEFAPAIPKC